MGGDHSQPLSFWMVLGFGLMAELRRRMYGSGIVALAEVDRRGGWGSAWR
jgi:hypothetical protein